MSNDTLAKAKKLFDEELESDFQVLLERWRKHVKGTGIEEKQLGIDDDSKKNLLTARTKIFFDEIDALTEKVYTGQITLGEYQETFKRMVRELNTSTAAIGKGGWDNVTSRDWGRTGPAIREQYRYLQGFVEYIDENRDTVSLKQLQARARLYGYGGERTAVMVSTPVSIADLLPWLPKDGSSECFYKADKVRVYTLDKGYIRLGSVKVGDYVLSHTGKFRKVTDIVVHNSGADAMAIEIEVVVYKTPVKLCVTPDHMFMTKAGMWIRADELHKGVQLMRIGRSTCPQCGNVIGLYNDKYKENECCSQSCSSKYHKKYTLAHLKNTELAAKGELAVQKYWAAEVLNNPTDVGDEISRLLDNHDGNYHTSGDCTVISVKEVPMHNGTAKCLVVDEDESFIITRGLISHNCLNGCKCRWMLTVTQTSGGYNYVEAVYRLGVADHCKTCIERNGHIENFRVPEHVEVPAQIGGY